MNSPTDLDPAVRAVIVGVDGTTTALRAVQWAVAEARLREVALEILHAAPYAIGPASHLGRQRADEILARAYTVARRAEPGVEVATSGTTDQPVATLLAASTRTELLVIGMRGHNQGEDIILGSTALSVSGRAHCPVVIARGRRSPRDSQRPVLVGVDGAASDAPALDFAFARRHGGPLRVLPARHGIGQLHDRLSGAEPAARFLDHLHLAEALGPWTRAYPDVPVELEVVAAHPSTALLAAAARARLLVVGSRGRSAPARALFGSTSSELLRRCPTPVAVLPPGATAAPVTDRSRAQGARVEQPGALSRLR